MFNLKKENHKYSAKSTLKRILSSVSYKLKKESMSDDLLSNIKGQLHRDFLEGECGHELNDSFDNKLEPIRKGFMQSIEKHGPEVHVETRELHPEEIEGFTGGHMGGIPDLIEKLLSGFDTMPFDNIFNIDSHDDMPHHMEQPQELGEDVIEEAVGNLGESVERLQNSVEDDLEYEDLDDTVEEDICNRCDCHPCQCDNHCEECDCDPCQCEECDECEDKGVNIMPEKIVKVPTSVLGGEDWHQVRADVDLAWKMAKTAEYSVDHILTIIEPTKYEVLSENIENRLINAYVDISEEKDMGKVASKLEKLAYTIVQHDDENRDSYLTQDDRYRKDGPIPHNYQKWFSEVGESHHEAMARLDEHKNPDNETMKLRIKDGERSNKMREELATVETRMRKEDMNDTEHSVLSNIEFMLDHLEKKLAGRREVDSEKSLEALLNGKQADKEKVWNQTLEARNAEAKHSKDEKEKLNRSIEARMDSDLDTRKDEYFEHVIDIILDDSRNDKKVLKTAGFGGGIVRDSRSTDLGIVPGGEKKNELEPDLPHVPERVNRGDKPTEWWLDPDNIKEQQQLAVQQAPTSAMQDDTSTIAMGSGAMSDPSMNPPAAGTPYGFGDNEDVHMPKAQDNTRKPNFPYGPTKFLT